MVRSFLGSIAGVVVAFVAMTLFAWLGGMVFPIPGNISLREPDQIRAAFEMAGLAPKLVILLSAALGALAGGVLAKWISGSRGPVWVVAIVMAAYGLANAFVLAMPPAMLIGAVIGPLIGGMIAERLLPSRPTPDGKERFPQDDPEAHRDDPI